MKCQPILCAVFLAFLTFSESQVAADDPTTTGLRVDAVSQPDGWQITRDGEVVLGYVKDSNGRPVLYPVMGPSGRSMTRAFPFTEAQPGEKADHDHHRSFWFTHGDVNGIDFWVDDKGSGVIKQISGDSGINDQGSAFIETTNRWQSPDGTPVLSDVRRVSLSDDNERYIIDFDITLLAEFADVRFGDTKEGSFGIRVAGPMKVDAGLGGVVTNSDGLNDKKAWGQPAAWVDYSGPTEPSGSDQSIAGITIHNHPSSYGYPTRWHVRTYGLLAANPFGKHHFVGGKPHDGILLAKGESMHLSYRVVLSDGSFDEAVTKKDATAYGQTRRPSLSAK